MLQRRLGIANHWLRGRRNNVSFWGLVKYLLAPPARLKARPTIVSVTREEGFRVIQFRGLHVPLYYPDELPMDLLYIVATESFYADSWHYYEIPETRVGPEDRVVDCGAAEGIFSLKVAPRCGRLYVIEPLPQFRPALELTLSPFRNVEIIPLALSDAPGEAFISMAGAQSRVGHDTAGDRVQVVTLDSLFHDQGRDIDYLKADIEGHDFAALLGASRTIAKCRPKVAITTYHAQEHAQKMQELLRELCPEYQFHVKGIEDRHGCPVMLHAWVT